MKYLLKEISIIINKLEQVQTITDNQRAVLLKSTKENCEMTLIEEMAEYKNLLMDEIEGLERRFEEYFRTQKDNIVSDQNIGKLQQKVAYILELKESIVDGEQKNFIILKDHLKTKLQPVMFQPNARKAAEAYQKYQKSNTKG